MTNFTEKETLGHIVTKFPESADFFMSHQMDYGYNGDETLEQAASKADLDIEQTLTSLNQRYNDFVMSNVPFIDWSLESTDDLITYVSEKHLTELRGEALAVGASSSGQLSSLLIFEEIQDTFAQLSETLKKHLAKEEAVFFTVLAYYKEMNLIETLRDLHGLIDDLDGEHETLTEQAMALHLLLSSPSEIPERQESNMLLLKRLKGFTQMIIQHIHLENNLLFKRI